MELAKELRVGNYILVDIGIPSMDLHQIKPDDFVGIANEDHYVLPIEITDEWLMNFGYKLVNVLHDGTKSYEGTPYLYFKDGIVKISVHTPEIKYVHQLQNLFYVLNGKELEIKQY